MPISMTSVEANVSLTVNSTDDQLCHWVFSRIDGENFTDSMVAARLAAQLLSECAIKQIPIIAAIVSIVFCFVGIPSNALVIAVWNRPDMRGASSFYLSVVAAFACLHLAIDTTHWSLVLSHKTGIIQMNPVCKAHMVLSKGSAYTVTALTLVLVLQRLLITKQAPPPAVADGATSPGAPSTSPAAPTASPDDDPDDLVKHVAILISAITLTVGIMAGLHVIFWGVNDQCKLKGELSDQYIIYKNVAEVIFGAVLPVAILIANVLLAMELKKIPLTSDGDCHTKPAPCPISTIRTVSCYRSVVVLVSTGISYVEYFFVPLSAASIEAGESRQHDWDGHIIYYQMNQMVTAISKSHFVIDVILCAATCGAFRRGLRSALCGGGVGRRRRENTTTSKMSRMAITVAGDLANSHSKTSCGAYSQAMPCGGQPNSHFEQSKCDIVVTSNSSSNSLSRGVPPAPV